MVQKQSTTPERANSKGFVYVGAGVFRGKKLQVVTSPGLRPIGSRVKEIFFNWIQFDVANRRVLDLFAGSGALGIEALSRGCQSLVMCEYSRQVFKTLQANYQSLNFAQLQQHYGFVADVKLQHTDSYAMLKTRNQHSAFDLVFVDPPFMQEQELAVLNDLAQQGYLAPQALIFLQLDAAYRNVMATLDTKRFQILKHKKLGNVLLYLLTFLPDGNAQSASVNELAEFEVV